MVELMIVVAVISVLASIIMPKMTGSRAKSQLVACKANLRNLGIAMELYAADNNGKYTPAATTSRTDYTHCSFLIPDYMKSEALCPTGHPYHIVANHPGLRSAPAGCTLIFCYPPTESLHPGLPNYCPYYWMGGKISEN